MTTYKTLTEAEQAAKQFFLENFNYTSGVGYEKKGENIIEFYSKNDPAMDDTFVCQVESTYEEA